MHIIILFTITKLVVSAILETYHRYNLFLLISHIPSNVFLRPVRFVIRMHFANQDICLDSIPNHILECKNNDLRQKFRIQVDPFLSCLH